MHTTNLSKTFDAGRYAGYRWFDLQAESASGRVTRIDVLLNALEMLTLSEADYIELFFGARENPDYIGMVADLLFISGVDDFFAHFRKTKLNDSQKRAWLAGFVDGVGSFHSLLGWVKPVKTKRERFSTVLG